MGQNDPTLPDIPDLEVPESTSTPKPEQEMAEIERFDEKAEGLTAKRKRSIPDEPDEQESPGERIRRERLASSRATGTLMAGILTLGVAGVALYRAAQSDQHYLQSPGIPHAPKEVVSQYANTSFGRILIQSEREKDPKTDTYRSRLLEPEAVTKHFLKGKLVHTAVEVDQDGQNLYHFSILGSKSGYWKDGQKVAPVVKTAAEVAEIVIDPLHRNSQEITEWLTWLYKKNGWGDLDGAGLKVEVDPKGKVRILAVNYTDDTKTILDVAADVERNQGHISHKNAITKEREFQPLANAAHTLLIPSGIAPLHDVVVPEKYLIQNPQFELPLGDGKKVSVSVERLDQVVLTYLALRSYAQNHLITEMIPKDDSTIDQITKSLIKPTMTTAQKYLALGQYIQTTTNYRSELDADENRPGLVTLFNGGSDCNNRSVLFVEMASHGDLPVALVSMDNTNPEKYEGHMRAGIPAKYFPGLKTIDSKKQWVSYEMAGGVTSPGVEYLGPNWVVTNIEPFGPALASLPDLKDQKNK